MVSKSGGTVETRNALVETKARWNGTGLTHAFQCFSKLVIWVAERSQWWQGFFRLARGGLCSPPFGSDVRRVTPGLPVVEQLDANLQLDVDAIVHLNCFGRTSLLWKRAGMIGALAYKLAGVLGRRQPVGWESSARTVEGFISGTSLAVEPPGLLLWVPRLTRRFHEFSTPATAAPYFLQPGRDAFSKPSVSGGAGSNAESLKRQTRKR